jgi:uncharacterized protein (TIGR00661 family)
MKEVKASNMKIAYGVMGYGRGHATRTAAVLPQLMAEHEVRVFAGNDAYDALATQFPTTRIPCIGYQYDSSGQLSTPLTIFRNYPIVKDALFKGAFYQQFCQELKDWGVDIIITDSEIWTTRVAKDLNVPIISFDHVGIINHCLPPFPPQQWFRGHLDRLGYKWLLPKADRTLVTSFYTALPNSDDIEVVGPIIRDEIRALSPHSGDYLLAYFNKGEHQYLPHVHQALTNLNVPVIVYGAGEREPCDNVTYKPLSKTQFAIDLAGSKALLSTCGNQTMGECLYLKKPVLVMPEDCFEQNLNAFMVERMGIGRRTSLNTLSSEGIEAFLDNSFNFRAAIAAYSRSEQSRDARDYAAQRLLSWINELTDSSSLLRHAA